MKKPFESLAYLKQQNYLFLTRRLLSSDFFAVNTGEKVQGVKNQPMVEYKKHGKNDLMVKCEE